MDEDSSHIKKSWKFFFALLIVFVIGNPILTGKSSTDESSAAIADTLPVWFQTVPDVFPEFGNAIQPQTCAISITSNPAERELHPLIIQAADRYDVEPALVKAIIMAESRYNSMAESSAGAMGLMQIMPATAQSLGVENGFDPEENIEAGVRYFKKLLKYFDGDVTLALAAYNAGLKNVLTYQGVPPFTETQTYIKKVFEYHRRYMQQPNDCV